MPRPMFKVFSMDTEEIVAFAMTYKTAEDLCYQLDALPGAHNSEHAFDDSDSIEWGEWIKKRNLQRAYEGRHALPETHDDCGDDCEVGC